MARVVLCDGRKAVDEASRESKRWKWQRKVGKLENWMATSERPVGGVEQGRLGWVNGERTGFNTGGGSAPSSEGRDR